MSINYVKVAHAFLAELTRFTSKPVIVGSLPDEKNGEPSYWFYNRKMTEVPKTLTKVKVSEKIFTVQEFLKVANALKPVCDKKD